LREKEQLWIEIEGLLVNAFGSIICMIGDFNLVRLASKRKGITSRVSNERDMVKFNELIERCALRDIPVVGRKFTWYRPDGTIRSRLD